MSNPVIREILRQGRGKPKSRVLAALETGRVETNFTNVSGGDADSTNWRQERASIYGGDMSIKRSVARFYQEAAALDHGQKSGELAADVQRPAAQYRGRYGAPAVHSEAMRLFNGMGGATQGSGTASVPARSSSGPMFGSASGKVFDQASYDQAVKRQKVAAMLQRSGHGSSALFRSGLLDSRPVDPTQFQTTQQYRTVLPGGGAASVVNAAAQPSSSTLSTAINEARSHLGLREVANNRGHQVDQLEQKFGMVGQPWCGIYLGTVLRKAGVHGVDSRVASVGEIETMARNHDGAFAGGWHSAAHARAGDALITRKGAHVAFVEKVDPDGTIHVIGGNQGTGEVSRGTWKPNQVYGVARPTYGRR